MGGGGGMSGVEEKGKEQVGVEGRERMSGKRREGRNEWEEEGGKE